MDDSQVTLHKCIKLHAAPPLKAHPLPDQEKGIFLAGYIGGSLGKLAADVQSGTTKNIGKFLRAERECFALYMETDTHVLIATDRVRGHPLFFSDVSGDWVVSPNGSPWENSTLKLTMDEKSEKIFLQTGYTFNQSTLIQGVSQLRAGEYGIFDKQTKSWKFEQYYQFFPQFHAEEKREQTETEAYWHSQLEVALDKSFVRTIERANGHTIWIPLSAGYDSRVVLAKLDALGYDNIQTFSYGTPGNMESVVAKEIAKKAGVPWQFVDSAPVENRNDFLGEEGRRFLLAGAGLSSVPALTEYVPLKTMMESDIIKDGDIIVNGQSGDYLTGGHIPNVSSYQELMSYAHTKHFATCLNIDGKGDASYGEVDTIALLELWAKENEHDFFDVKSSVEQLIAEYLLFEWQERQSSYVVNQQRMYEYFGIGWSLPLWDADLMDLYEEVPFELQKNQNLYIEYLSKWNHKGLFDEGRRPYDPWPQYKYPIMTAARLAGLVGGKKLKNKVYQKFYYFSDLHFIYGLFGYSTYQKMKENVRSPVTLILLEYLSNLKSTLAITDRSYLENKYLNHRK